MDASLAVSKIKALALDEKQACLSNRTSTITSNAELDNEVEGETARRANQALMAAPTVAVG
jgi:hypothetical protein